MRVPRGLPIQEISCGVPFIYVPLASRAAVDAAEPDLAALRALRSAFPDGHNAVFLFAVEPQVGDVTVYSRMFAPGLGVPEDAATGGASGPLGCYLVAHELVPSRGLDRHGEPAGREDAAAEPHPHAHHRPGAAGGDEGAGRGTGCEGWDGDDRYLVISRSRESGDDWLIC